MSTSDPTSSSLNLSTDTVQGCVGEVTSMRSRSSSPNSPNRNGSLQKMIQFGGSGRRPLTSIVKSLPKASQSRGPSPSNRGQGSVDVPIAVHHHQELNVRDDRTQTVAMGVDPVESGRMVDMVGEAQRLLDESKSRADHFEGLSKEIFSQACQQVQQLMTIAQQLHLSCFEKDESLQKLSFEVHMVKAQLPRTNFQQSRCFNAV